MGSSYVKKRKSKSIKKKSKRTNDKGKSKKKPKRVVSNNGTWSKFLNNKDSRKALSKSWTSKHPQKYYNSTIKRLARKYSNAK
jgi:ribonuclease HI